VVGEVAALRKGLFALGALERFFASMLTHVHLPAVGQNRLKRSALV
jgi:hypothetical protein